jgi:UDP-4-amino-4,6-dideoxy-N-acetyl-beta-L-altrosamine N-acetyltransferase
MTDQDLSMVLSWRNHPDVRRYMLTQHEITLDEHRKWFSRVGLDEKRRQLIVEYLGDEIGFVQFSGITSSRVAEWSFHVKPGSPRGAGHGLGIVALKYAFEDLKVHKVCGQALDFNNASIAFHLRLGFLKEGVLRDQYFINGIYSSLICFGLIEEEWKTWIASNKVRNV